MHSILTPRSKTCQRLYEYEALHKLTSHLQYPARPNWEKSRLNGNRKTHCDKTPSMSQCCPLPAAPVHPCASLFPHPITHSVFLQGAPLALVAPRQQWPCRGGGMARSWVVPLAPGCYRAPPHATGNSLMRREVSATIKMERGCHAVVLVSLFWEEQAICRCVPSREHAPISLPAPVPQLQSGWAHP